MIQQKRPWSRRFVQTFRRSATFWAGVRNLVPMKTHASQQEPFTV